MMCTRTSRYEARPVYVVGLRNARYISRKSLLSSYGLDIMKMLNPHLRWKDSYPCHARGPKKWMGNKDMIVIRRTDDEFHDMIGELMA